MWKDGDKGLYSSQEAILRNRYYSIILVLSFFLSKILASKLNSYPIPKSQYRNCNSVGIMPNHHQ